MEEKFDILNELGEFTGKIATREECHKSGLWHREVLWIIKEIYYCKKEAVIRNYGLICGM